MKKICLITMLVFLMLCGCAGERNDSAPGNQLEENPSTNESDVKQEEGIKSAVIYTSVEETKPNETANGGAEPEFAPYTMSECEDGGAELEFYSKGNQMIYKKKFVYADHTYVENVKEDLYKIISSTGVNSNYTVFVDTAKSKVSEPYFNLLFNDENTVAFMEESTLYLTDMFDSEKIYASVSRDFADTAVPRSAILSFKMKDGVIYLNYLSGDDYEEIFEQIEVGYDAGGAN